MEIAIETEDGGNGDMGMRQGTTTGVANYNNDKWVDTKDGMLKCVLQCDQGNEGDMAHWDMFDD